MSYIPSSKLSSGRLITTSRRGIRLCNKAGAGAQVYGNRIEAAIPALEKAVGAAQDARLAAAYAHDQANLARLMLDDAVRTAFEKCEQHDRLDPANPVMAKVFPEGVYSNVVWAAGNREPFLVRQIANRIREFGPDSAIAAVANDLDAAIETVNQAVAEALAKTLAYDDARTKEVLAREELLKTYKAAYFDACVERGRRFARTVFPRLKSRGEDTAPQPGGDSSTANSGQDTSLNRTA